MTYEKAAARRPSSFRAVVGHRLGKPGRISTIMPTPRDEAFRAKIADLFPPRPGPSLPLMHHVVIPTLNREHLHDRFEIEFHQRRRWCASEFGREFAAAGVFDKLGRRTATRFSFTTIEDAMQFRLRFDDP